MDQVKHGYSLYKSDGKTINASGSYVYEDLLA